MANRRDEVSLNRVRTTATTDPEVLGGASGMAANDCSIQVATDDGSGSWLDHVCDSAIPRRVFLATLTGSIAASAAALQVGAAPQDLFLLKKGNMERLRLDFNSYREKVRLVALLSPT